MSARRLILGDDLFESEAGADPECDKQIDHHADSNEYDDRTADIAVRVDDFGAAVGDRGEAFERENRQCDRRREACDRDGLSRCGGGLERKSAGCERRNSEDGDATDFQECHDGREQADRAVARDVDEIREDDQPDAEHGCEDTVRSQVERPEDVGAEGSRNEALADHHGERH